jgi:hypothetical protein
VTGHSQASEAAQLQQEAAPPESALYWVFGLTPAVVPVAPVRSWAPPWYPVAIRNSWSPMSVRISTPSAPVVRQSVNSSPSHVTRISAGLGSWSTRKDAGFPRAAGVAA